MLAGDGQTSTQLTASGSAPSGPICEYRLAVEPLGYFLYWDAATREPLSEPGPGVETWMEVRCPGSPVEFRWVPAPEAVVACDGLGTPYPVGANSYEQGPCGYTYTTVTDVGVREVTATANWSVRLVTSTGIDRMLDPVARSTSFPYRVYEITTVIEG